MQHRVLAVALVAIFFALLPQLAVAAAATATPIKAPLLEVFSAFAGLAAAISIAYAGLPNFRHRARVEAHVRKRVQDTQLRENLDPILCRMDRWGVLYRLGKLREMREMPAPGNPDLEGDVDRSFQKRPAFRAYSWIYASNFDKIIASALGALASTLIWYAALDNVYFYQTVYDTPERLSFLGGITTFYWTTVSVTAVAVVLHKFCWRWNLERGCTRHNLIVWLGIVMVLIWSCLFILASYSGERLANLWTSNAHVYTYFTTQQVLLAAAVIPLILLWGGESLTRIMISEADNSVNYLVARIDERVGAAQVGPPPAAAPVYGPQVARGW